MQQRTGRAGSTCIFIATIFYLQPAADNARRSRGRCPKVVGKRLRLGRRGGKQRWQTMSMRANPARSSHITHGSALVSQSDLDGHAGRGKGESGSWLRECLKHKKYADNKNLLSAERLSSMQHAVARPDWQADRQRDRERQTIWRADRLYLPAWWVRWRGKLLFGACQTANTL